jgi:hypothetical protein
MSTASYLRTGALYTLGFAAVLFALIGLAACDATGGVGQPEATPGRPTATVQAVRTRTPRPLATATLEEFFPEDATATPEELEEPTSTPRRRATSTPEEEPTEEPTATIEDEPTPVAEAGYRLYQADEGDWSLEYPEDWIVNESPPNVQFLEPAGEAFIQLTFSEGGGLLTNEELADLASEQFEINFEDYVERGRTEQGDGSWRIDFNFSASGSDWHAQTFVEGRQGNLYMLLLATTEDAFQDGTYSDIIDHVLATYTVPKD